ncbi:hypothetical protein [Streptomyces varsoviensis]|uniref:Uncharacterized protein n=1 Tax=Streptomyces varsoviensis TaxID=67373 RepID=A0ABR5J4X9_9ACTN|nr:hypothetical protein [Streptomyces varsoviensis]KOG88196.1 hypothetical protein ADK38_21130 [Streptomyces varsoviensis]
MSFTSTYGRHRVRRAVVASVIAAAAIGLTATVSDAAPAPDHASAAGAHRVTTVSPEGADATGVSGTWRGTLKYLAPGKVTVAPKSGMEQGFHVGPHTKVLGAAAICGGPDGNVTIDSKGDGTTPCTLKQLMKAAKTDAVKVRATVKNGVATTIAEHYHP